MKRGDKVYVSSLNADGKIHEKLNNGFYRVACNDLLVSVHEKDLLPARPSKKSKLPKKPKVSFKSAKGAKRGKTSSSLDLHGMTTDEAVRELERHLNRAILDGMERVEVIHGIGTGRVREAVHKYLGNLPAVEAFRPDPANPGVTWVYL